MRNRRMLVACALLFRVSTAMTVLAASPWEAADLNPVQIKMAPKHPPITLVKNGKPLAAIVTGDRQTGARDLQHFINLLPIILWRFIKPSRWQAIATEPCGRSFARFDHDLQNRLGTTCKTRVAIPKWNPQHTVAQEKVTVFELKPHARQCNEPPQKTQTCIIWELYGSPITAAGAPPQVVARWARLA